MVVRGLCRNNGLPTVVKLDMNQPSRLLNESFRLTVTALFLLLVALFPRPGSAQTPPTPEATAFFEKSIRPALAEKCYSCHGEKAQFAGLRLDSRAAMLKGGEKGSVLNVASPDKSRLLSALSYGGAIKMPPSGKLPDAVLADFASWVKIGAPWPAGATAAHIKTMAERVSEARSRLWSLQPVRQSPLPSVKDAAWVKTPIDRFVLAKLEAKGIKPARAADRIALLRRASYDLIGLPPTTEEIAAFVTDKSPGAYEKVVDRLLASPHYGERWGRHWLDLARYSDTLGYLVGNVGDVGRIYPYAYTYRDYVVRAFNSDKPYDRFVKEQLAADLLNVPDKRDLAALGFITIGNRYLGNGQEIIDDRIDVVTRGLQGMTVACARCHDHKFDAIPAADYYSLYGVFNSIHEPDELPRIGEPTDTKAYEALRLKLAPLEKQLEARLNTKNDPEAKKLRDQIKQIVLNDPGAPPCAMVVEDNEKPNEPHILLRGNPGTPGEPVKRQFLLAVLGESRQPFTKGSGRLELAEAIASPTNPLTARVLVNRVWLHHFGKPLVATPSDFGVRGALPTHPELLDYLAATFMQGGWSIKKLHRQILLSSVYRQSSDGDPATTGRDPENRLLGRMNRQRMEFEPLRDTLLQLSGSLDTAIGGRPIQALLGDNRRRTIYAFVDRQDLPGLLRTFDFAEPGAHAPQRPVTTVPQQALFLMNNPFVLKQVRGILARPEIAHQESPAARIRELFRLIYGHAPSPFETSSSLAFISNWQGGSTDTLPTGPAWQYGYGEYDPTARNLKSFSKLPHFTGQAWQGGLKLPDTALGWVLLTAGGGHPGDKKHSAIRRWTAPYDTIVNVQGRLDHPGEPGDGVEGLVISSRSGVLGSWTVHKSSADTRLAGIEVRRGDTLDFVVSSRENVNTDGFQWSPTVEATRTPAADRAGETHWDAAADFSGPVTGEAPKPMTSWETYAQALLLTNEFLFID